MTKIKRFIRWCIPICIAVQACIPSIAAQNGGNCAIDPRCPRFDTGDSAVLVPHPDCGKFYKCALGKACEYNCPANLHFNPILLTCDYPHVACCSRDHSSCEKFYMCSGGEACEVDCPPGLHFNAQQSRCDYQDAACCDTSIPCARTNLEVPMSSCIPDVRCSLYENPFDPTHLPHPTNCNRFYKCSYGKACELPCPQGQHFSVAMNRCEFPEVACCDKSIRCSGPYAVSDLYPETRDEPIKPAEPVEPREEPTKAPNAPTPESIRINTCFEAQQCPDGDGRMNQLMRHNDCTKFFSCFQGTICEFVCPIGLHFNERSKVCDKPEIAQCSQGFN
ncbi:hypothetical protein quinque_007974 [Culex quinquefasciatus]